MKQPKYYSFLSLL